MRELSRRDALAAGLAGVAAVALGPAAAPAADADPGPALTALVRAEQDAVFVYRGARLGKAGARLAAQDGEHVSALATHVEALGLPMPGPTRAADGLGAPALAVLRADTRAARLEAAIAFEQSLLDGGAGRLGRLAEAGIVRTVATIMAGHAQHQLLLIRTAGRDPLSSGP